MTAAKTSKEYKREAIVKLETIWNPKYRNWEAVEFLSGLNMVIFDYAFNAGWEAKTKEVNNIKNRGIK